MNRRVAFFVAVYFFCFVSIIKPDVIVMNMRSVLPVGVFAVWKDKPQAAMLIREVSTGGGVGSFKLSDAHDANYLWVVEKDGSNGGSVFPLPEDNSVISIYSEQSSITDDYLENIVFGTKSKKNNISWQGKSDRELSKELFRKLKQPIPDYYVRKLKDIGADVVSIKKVSKNGVFVDFKPGFIAQIFVSPLDIKMSKKNPEWYDSTELDEYPLTSIGTSEGYYLKKGANVIGRKVYKGINFNEKLRKTPTKTIIPGTIFSHCGFSSVSFDGLTLSNITFDNCGIDDSSFKNAKILNCKFKNQTLLQSVDFSEAVLTDVSFNNSGATYPKFKGATLNNVQFVGGQKYSQCVLIEPDFDKIKKQNIQLCGRIVLSGDFSGMSLGYVELIDLNNFKNKLSYAQDYSKGYGPLKINFSGCDLRKSKIENALLKGVNFSGADLAGSSLKNSKLIKANFSNAKMGSINLEGSNLTNANFSNSKASETNLNKAILTGASFVGTDLSNSVLDGSTLSNTDFSNGILTSVTLSGTVGGRTAIFKNSNLKKVDLRPIKGSGVNTKINLEGANLCGANLQGFAFKDFGPLKGACVDKTTKWFDGKPPFKSGSLLVRNNGMCFSNWPCGDLSVLTSKDTIENLDFSYQEISKWLNKSIMVNGKQTGPSKKIKTKTFKNCVFDYADFSWVDMPIGFDWSKVSVSMSDHYLKLDSNGLDLSSCKFINCSFIGANIKNVNLSNSKMIGANLEGACLNGAILHNVDLTNANLKMANFVDSDLRGTNLTGTKNFAFNIIRSSRRSWSDISDYPEISGAFVYDTTINSDGKNITKKYFDSHNLEKLGVKHLPVYWKKDDTPIINGAYQVGHFLISEILFVSDKRLCFVCNGKDKETTYYFSLDREAKDDKFWKDKKAFSSKLNNISDPIKSCSIDLYVDKKSKVYLRVNIDWIGYSDIKYNDLSYISSNIPLNVNEKTSYYGEIGELNACDDFMKESYKLVKNKVDKAKNKNISSWVDANNSLQDFNNRGNSLINKSSDVRRALRFIEDGQRSFDIADRDPHFNNDGNPINVWEMVTKEAAGVKRKDYIPVYEISDNRLLFSIDGRYFLDAIRTKGVQHGEGWYDYQNYPTDGKWITPVKLVSSETRDPLDIVVKSVRIWKEHKYTRHYYAIELTIPTYTSSGDKKVYYYWNGYDSNRYLWYNGKNIPPICSSPNIVFHRAHSNGEMHLTADGMFGLLYSGGLLNNSGARNNLGIESIWGVVDLNNVLKYTLPFEAAYNPGPQKQLDPLAKKSLERTALLMGVEFVASGGITALPFAAEAVMTSLAQLSAVGGKVLGLFKHHHKPVPDRTSIMLYIESLGLIPRKTDPKNLYLRVNIKTTDNKVWRFYSTAPVWTLNLKGATA